MGDADSPLGGMPEVLVYRRDGCHLCDEADEALAALAAERGDFTVRTVDIEADERLHRDYLERIPVVEVEGEVVCELWLDRGALIERLDTVGTRGHD